MLQQQSDDEAAKVPATVLSSAVSRHIDDLVHGETGQVREIPKLPEPPTWRVIFFTASTTIVTIGLDVREPTVIGRSEVDGEPITGLDLASHKAFENGVSRQHAALIPAAEALYLIDLDSRNGTWVNGNFVQPGQRCPIQVGDSIELGLLKVVVRSLSRLGRT